jgi:hypothetical protein
VPTCETSIEHLFDFFISRSCWAYEAAEDAVYDSQALRNFLGIDLGRK